MSGCIPGVEVALTLVDIVIARVELATGDLALKEPVDTTFTPLAPIACFGAGITTCSRAEVADTFTLSIA